MNLVKYNPGLMHICPFITAIKFFLMSIYNTCISNTWIRYLLYFIKVCVIYVKNCQEYFSSFAARQCSRRGGDVRMRVLEGDRVDLIGLAVTVPKGSFLLWLEIKSVGPLPLTQFCSCAHLNRGYKEAFLTTFCPAVRSTIFCNCFYIFDFF